MGHNDTLLTFVAECQVTFNTKTATVSIAAQAARPLPSEARRPQPGHQSVAVDREWMEAILNVFYGARLPASELD